MNSEPAPLNRHQSFTAWARHIQIDQFINDRVLIIDVEPTHAPA